MAPSPGIMLPNFGEISSSKYKDIAFTRFSESYPAVALAFDCLTPK